MPAPDGYRENSKNVLTKLKAPANKNADEQQHDDLVAAVIDAYTKAGCKPIYVAKSPGGGKSPKTCDLVIICPSSTCKICIIFVEVKGESGLDAAVKQLEKGSEAATKAGLIKKDQVPTDNETLNKCFHSLILVQDGKSLKNAGKLRNEENQTPIGPEAKMVNGRHEGPWITPTWNNDIKNLPQCGKMYYGYGYGSGTGIGAANM